MLSVCIPYANKPAAFLEEAARSAATALPAGGELIVLADGPTASATARSARLPDGTQLIEHTEAKGLCGNWNAALEVARGDLIHILHDDDTVDRRFYDTVLFLAQAFPRAAL